jgi:uncharacterized membrane protein YfcA
MVHGFGYMVIGLSAVGAGMVNALSGGGTLITFPTLVALGVPPVVANVTNTVALCPGYLGATFAQFKDLKGQRRRLVPLLVAGFIGGIIGGFLLLHTGERAFGQLVPFLILLASGLLAVQEPLRAWLVRHPGRQSPTHALETWAFMPIALAAVYGGYFGAGLSVIILATLGLMIEDSLTRLNALKQSISFSANIAAAVLFIYSGKVIWPSALVMAVGALLGGVIGGKLAGTIKPVTLRWVVVAVGLAVGVAYLLRGR